MLKRCIFRCWLIVSVSILNLALFCSTLLVALLVVDICLRLNLCCFGLLNTSSRSPRCWVDLTVSIFLALFCLTPRAALLIVDMSLSQSFLLWFAQHLESLCSLLTWLDCLDLSCFVLLNTPVALFFVDVVSTVSTFLNTLTRSGHCSDVSDSFLNTLTFVKLVLVSFSRLYQSNLLPLMFHSPELLQCFKSVSVFLLFVLLLIV